MTLIFQDTFVEGADITDEVDGNDFESEEDNESGDYCIIICTIVTFVIQIG